MGNKKFGKAADAVENDLTGNSSGIESLGNNSTNKSKVEKASGIEAAILYVAIAIIIGIAVSSIILIAYGTENSTFLGMGIIGSGISIYIASKMYRTVPQKQEWVIEIFERYYTTWKPGLHFLIPGIMTIRGKITVDATKMIRIFMRGDEDKLDFEDDSAEVTVEIRARALESYKPTYEIIFTDDEIRAIEDEEKKRGNVPLPEYWMYLLLMRVEAALRGTCGRIKLDEAIKSIARKTETGNKVMSESKFSKDVSMEVEAVIKDISREVEAVVDEALKEKYAIDVEEILIRNIKLHKDTEEARRKIHLAEKSVLVEEQGVLQEDQKALQQDRIGGGTRNRLDAIAKDTNLSRGDVMDWELAMKAAEKVEGVTILGSGDGRSTPLKLGAEFGAGFGAVEKRDKKRRDEE